MQEVQSWWGFSEWGIRPPCLTPWQTLFTELPAWLHCVFRFACFLGEDLQDLFEEVFCDCLWLATTYFCFSDTILWQELFLWVTVIRVCLLLSCAWFKSESCWASLVSLLLSRHPLWCWGDGCLPESLEFVFVLMRVPLLPLLAQYWWCASNPSWVRTSECSHAFMTF